jgi:hypothetical protein
MAAMMAFWANDEASLNVVSVRLKPRKGAPTARLLTGEASGGTSGARRATSVPCVSNKTTARFSAIHQGLCWAKTLSRL